MLACLLAAVSDHGCQSDILIDPGLSAQTLVQGNLRVGMHQHDLAASSLGALEHDMAELQEGIRLLFVNEFKAAEELFQRGAHREPLQQSLGAAVGPNGPAARDLRGAFALIWTLVSLMFGMLSFANDQLDECLRRVWLAEGLLLEDRQWVGQRMCLGMVYLIAGVVQAAKNAWLKAGVNFVRCLRYIHEFEEGLRYEGPEKALVRSTGLFFLGLFNLVLSMLPPQVLRVASRAGGEALQGSRKDALGLLSMCRSEGDVMAPFAAVALLCHCISLKTYLGEEGSTADVAACRELLAWAAERFPDSAVFGFWQTEFHAALQEIPEASRCVSCVHDVLAHLQLPAVDSFLEQKKAYLSIAVLDWRASAEGCERSLAVSVARKRRSYVPFLSYVAGLAWLLTGDYAASEAAFERIARYARLRKWNWPPEDELAFQKAKEYGPAATGACCALLDLVEVSMLKLHLLHTMADDVKLRLDGLLRDAAWCSATPHARRPGAGAAVQDLAPEEAARCLLFRAELARLRGDKEEARRLALCGLELAPRLGPRGASNGTAAMLHLTLALLGVEGHLKAMDRCPRACRAFDEALKFKRLGVARQSAVGFQASVGSMQGTEQEQEQGMGAEEEFFSAEEDSDGAMAARRVGGTEAAGPGLGSSGGSGTCNQADERVCERVELEMRVDQRHEQVPKSVARPRWRLPRAMAIGSAMPQPALGGGSSPSSSPLLLEALLRQADQGDCSVVQMPPPEPGASKDEVSSYLRWAQWSSLRGMPRQEALRRYALMARDL